MPGLSEGIASDIRDGTIKKYLTQPVDMLGYLFWYPASRTSWFTTSWPRSPFGLVFLAVPAGYFSGWPDGLTTTAWVALAPALVSGRIPLGSLDRADRLLVPRSRARSSSFI